MLVEAFLARALRSVRCLSSESIRFAGGSVESEVELCELEVTRYTTTTIEAINVAKVRFRRNRIGIPHSFFSDVSS